MKRILQVLTVAAAVLVIAGAVTIAARFTPEGVVLGATATSAIVSHATGGLVPVPIVDQAIAGLVLPVGQKGAEPTLGVTSSGALFVTGVTDSDIARMWRSMDRGESWQELSFPAPRLDFDPYLHVDRATDRVFSAPLYRECTNLMWSDDEGASWQFTPTSALAGCPHMQHDHQSLTTGAPRGVLTAGYPNVVYYSYQSADPVLQGTYVTRSLDGGSTWAVPDGVMVFPSDCQGGIAGAPVAAPDGVLYLPKPGCNGILVGVSEDSGATWRSAEIADVGIQGGSGATLDHLTQTAPLTPNPAVAVDSDGVAYVVWTGADAQPYLSTSRDLGRNWSTPVRIAPPDVTATVFTAAVAGGSGRVAIAYLATRDPTDAWQAPGAHYAPPTTRWDLYVTMSANATASDPLFTTLRATPDEDPVQRGCIWQAGGESRCRNLRDYISIVEHEGRVLVAYADGCARCASADQSRGSAAHVLVLDAGPSLRDGSPLPRYR